jgi:transcriptional regulator with XRE-family HTH domain
MERRNLTGAALSETSGVDPAQISRLRNGERDWIDHHDLKALLGALPDPGDRAELLRARLLDENVGPGSELIDIVIRNPSLALHDRPEARVRLPARHRKALEAIALGMESDENLRELIYYLAEIYKQDDDP